MNAVLTYLTFLTFFAFLAFAISTFTKRFTTDHIFLKSSLLAVLVLLSEVYFSGIFQFIKIDRLFLFNCVALSCFFIVKHKLIIHVIRKFNFRSVLKNVKWLYSLPVLIFVFIAVLPGMLGGPSTDDERSYHWPQALAMVQSNHFVVFDSKLPWTYSYPLGNASISAFTWGISQSDFGFRSPQIIFYLIGLVSIFGIAEKFLSFRYAVIISTIFGISPLMGVMLKMTTADLAYGSMILASINLLLTSVYSRTTKSKLENLLFGLLAFILSGQFKFPVLSFLLIAPLIIVLIIQTDSKNHTKFRVFFMSLLASVFGFVYMIRNFFSFNNPFFPMSVDLGVYKFLGPMAPIDNNSVRPSTTFKLEEPLRTLKIYHAVFHDFFQQPNPDSLGSFNFLIGLLLLATSFIGIAMMYSRNRSLSLYVVYVLVLYLIIPGSYLPRYSFFLVGIFTLFSLIPFESFVSSKNKLFPILLVVSLGAIPTTIETIRAVKWIESQRDLDVPLFNNASLASDIKFEFGSSASYLPPALISFIRDNVRENENVCYSAAADHPSNFWNLKRSNTVSYTPIAQSERYPISRVDQNYSQETLVNWIKNNKKCDWLTIYSQENIGTLVDLGYVIKINTQTLPEITILRKVKQSHG